MGDVMENLPAFENVTGKFERVDNNPHMAGFQGYHYKCILSYDGRRITVYFSKGYGLKGEEPSIEEILSCLFTDIDSMNSSGGFGFWADELGYTGGEIAKAEKIYKTIQRQEKQLRALLADYYDEIQDIVYKNLYGEA
jgi:hypothetical protein